MNRIGFRRCSKERRIKRLGHDTASTDEPRNGPHLHSKGNQRQARVLPEEEDDDR